MTLFVLSYLAGALTIFAPCILPVLPFAFARADEPFLRSGLPMLAGLSLGFAAVATLATVAAGWAVTANETARIVALVALTGTGLALLLPRLATAWSSPLVALGAHLDERAQRRAQVTGRSVLPSLILGLATGLLWAPCAGPILGLVLSTAALQGPRAHTVLFLAAYGAGAATSIALALWAGRRVFAAMKRALGVGEWIRRGLGIAVLAGVTMIATGLDGELVALLPSTHTDVIEQGLLQRWHRRPSAKALLTMPGAPAPAAILPAALPLPVAVPALDLPVEGQLPELSGATTWLNSAPLSPADLRGKVVLVDIWTFDCINCRNALPYVRNWAEKYKDQGLVVIGVHSPEFAFERKLENVKRAVHDLGLHFPIAIDNDFAIWRAFNNEYWPAHYFVDARGRIRFHKFGEGDYEKSERVIQQLLKEAHESGGV